jgi:uncharacterized membrane protein
MPAKTSAPDTSVEAKLDTMIDILEKMNTRDRLRTWGGFIRGILALIPLILFVWSAWYFVNHGEELMKMIANQAASSAAEYTKNQGQSMVDQLMNQYAVPKK